MFLDRMKSICFSKLFLSMTTAKKVSYLGIFLALSIVANLFSIDVTPSLKISFNYFVGFFAGCYFGGVGGFFILWLGDLLGFLLPTGASVYWPLTGIATGLLAFIPGIIMNLPPIKVRGGVFIKAAISCLLMYLLVTCFFSAISNYLYVKLVIYGGSYEKTFLVYLSAKIAFSTVVSVVNYALVFIFIPVLNSIKPLKLKIE